MIKLFTLFYLISLSSSLFATSWNLQVTDANFELTQHLLPEEEFKPFLAKTSWRCWFGASEVKGEVHRKQIRCNYSVRKTGEFVTWVSCSRSRPEGEASFELVDEKKGLLLKILATCQFKEPTS